MATRKSASSPTPRISLEQWRCFAAVVEAGGYAQAAESLHKSQSSVTYAVQKLQSALGVQAFEIQGRKAVLTTTGQMLYGRARVLLEDASSLERAAGKASAGWEAEISIVVEVVFPTWLMLDCLAEFGTESPQTRIEYYEGVMGGTAETLLSGDVDLAIAASIPRGFGGERLMTLHFLPVASPNHPLHKLGRKLTLRDLRKHRHLVVRDSGSKRDKGSVSIDVAQRWAVTNMATSIGAAIRGYGFAWFPLDKIRDELARGALKTLPMREDQARVAELYLIYTDREAAGPGVLRLAEIIREKTAQLCTTAVAST
jgi:DNA-binding transcriptional LysR family regulator